MAFVPILASSKVLADSISARKDVVLYGSDTGERYVGGAAVKAQLARWGLQFAQVGGTMEGITADKQVVWFATNVDTTPTKGAKPAAPVPYRAFIVLAKSGKSEKATWELVAAQFAVVTK